MKKLFAMAALAAFGLPAAATLSVDEACSGYSCENMCPLAEQANSHRAYGCEAVTVASVTHAELAQVVELNLARI